MAETTSAVLADNGIVIPTDAEIQVAAETRELPPQRALEQKRPERPLASNGRPIGNPNHSHFVGEHEIPKGRRKGEKQKVLFHVLNAADIDPQEAAELIHQMNPDHWGTKMKL